MTTHNNHIITKNIRTIHTKPLIIIALSIPFTLTIGCEKPLFTDRMPRTQYESYDRIHGTFVPTTITDRNGQEQPNLRERLRPPRG